MSEPYLTPLDRLLRETRQFARGVRCRRCGGLPSVTVLGVHINHRRACANGETL